jgi:transcriptional regulator with XRE-family HTH domain
MQRSPGRLYELVGERLKEHRKRLGLTQALVAERARVVRTSIANIESGRQAIPLHLFYRLCIALEIDVRDILPAVADVTDLIPTDVEKVTKAMPPKAAKLLKKLISEEGGNHVL